MPSELSAWFNYGSRQFLRSRFIRAPASAVSRIAWIFQDLEKAFGCASGLSIPAKPERWRPGPDLSSSGAPYLTAGANSGKSGRARREQALRLMGIRPARLEPLALRTSGHERMANRWAAAGEEKRIELSETIAWFGDILNIDAPLVEIGPRSVFNNSAIGARQGSLGHALATGKDRWRCRRASRRRHREAQAGTPNLLSIPDNGAWLNVPGSIFSALICWPDGGKTPRKDVPMKVKCRRLSVAARKGATFAGQSEPAIGPQNRDLSWEC